MDWLDLLAVQGTLKSLHTTVQKHQFLALSFLYSPTLTSIHDYWISSLRGPKLGSTWSDEPTLNWAMGESQHDSILNVQGREHWPCGAVCNVGMPAPLQRYRKLTYPFRAYSNTTSSRKPSLTSSLKACFSVPLTHQGHHWSMHSASSSSLCMSLCLSLPWPPLGVSGHLLCTTIFPGGLGTWVFFPGKNTEVHDCLTFLGLSLCSHPLTSHC